MRIALQRGRAYPWDLETQKILNDFTLSRVFGWLPSQIDSESAGIVEDYLTIVNELARLKDAGGPLESRVKEITEGVERASREATTPSSSTSKPRTMPAAP